HPRRPPARAGGLETRHAPAREVHMAGSERRRRSRGACVRRGREGEAARARRYRRGQPSGAQPHRRAGDVPAGAGVRRRRGRQGEDQPGFHGVDARPAGDAALRPLCGVRHGRQGLAGARVPGRTARRVRGIAGDRGGTHRDRMQKIAAEVADLSGRVFDDGRVETRHLRRWLVHVGALEARLARSRGTLLGITRIAVFTCEKNPAWIPEAQQSPIDTVRDDLVALYHIDAATTEKLQFLLDAIFGLISVNQNNVMKLFTVASVVAVPPVILAGIWGMNFKAMPELSEPW